MSQRFEGKNLEEALGEASASLGVERYRLTYHVVAEKRGFLGGMKRIVIEAEVNTAPVDEEVPVQRSSEREPGQSAPPRRDGGGGRGQGRGRRGGSGNSGGRGRGRDGDRQRTGGRGRAESTLQSGDFELFSGEIPEQGSESEMATTARIWIEKVLSLAKLSLVLRTEENEEQLMIRLYGSDAALLVDRHGELLDAIQVLANKALVGRSVEKEIELDCNSFKEKRVEDLQERARHAADRVRRDGREQLLPAMSPVERRIVHLALEPDAEVTTESRGEGFFKRVAVIPLPAGEKQAASEP